MFRSRIGKQRRKRPHSPLLVRHAPGSKSTLDAYTRAVSNRDAFERLWMRFGSEVDPARGVAAAFALVSCYDGTASAAEVKRYAEFADTLPSSDAYRSEPISAEIRQATFDAITRAILDDFDAGRESALAVLRRFKGNVPATEMILRAAQAAIVADGVDEVREEVGLSEVCQALGVDPALY
jgi:tellurite resistance protein